jgi:hypothetical protein
MCVIFPSTVVTGKANRLLRRVQRAMVCAGVAARAAGASELRGKAASWKA